MSIKDRLTHAAEMTKWKTDQQMRLLKSQNEVRALEGNVRTEKARLADTVIALNVQGKISENELMEICKEIDQISDQIHKETSLQDLIKQEQSPTLTSYSDYSAEEPGSGLICPECGRPLIGRFCPEHGIEGIPTTQNLSTSNEFEENESSDDISSNLICPICKKPLTASFCPEHGIAGVPKQ